MDKVECRTTLELFDLSLTYIPATERGYLIMASYSENWIWIYSDWAPNLFDLDQRLQLVVEWAKGSEEFV